MLSLRIFLGVLFVGGFVTLAIAAGNLVDPKNDPDVQAHMKKGYLEILVDAEPNSGITRELALQIREDFLSYSASLLTNDSRKLEINMDWENPYYTAHARYRPGSLYIALWGGYLRAPGLNSAIIAVTLCHELGHLIGGEPKQTNERGENVSTEGQADFYAAIKCTADFLRKYPQYAPSAITVSTRQFCEGHWDCEMSLESGLRTYLFLQKWGFVPYTPVSLEQTAEPAKEFVPNTYPSYQCRVDTFKAAATCLKQGTKDRCMPPPCWWPLSVQFKEWEW